MKTNLQFYKAVILTALFTSTFIPAHAQYVYSHENLINEKAVQKIEEIGTEVKNKLNINIYLYANKTINGKTMIEYREEIREKQKESYVVLLFTQKEKKVDIITSKNLEGKFDIEEVLNPFNGTIIPLLITKPKKDAIDDRVSAAMLNGYADIADKLAQRFNIELSTSIGNSNRNIINTMRVVFYISIIMILILYFRKKFVRKKQ